MVIMLSGASVRCAHGEGAFYMTRPKLGLGTFYRYEEEERTLSDSTTESTTHDMREYVTLQADGWVIHPNLMGYRLAIQPEWRQESFRKSPLAAQEAQSPDRDSSVTAYDVKATFLEQKPLSLDLFSNRTTRQIDHTDLPDTDVETRSWGSRLRFTNAVLPVTASYTNSASDRTGFYTTEEDREILQISIRHLLKRSVSGLNILRDDTRKTMRITADATDVRSDTTNAEFNNTLFFSGDERVRLDSLVYLGRTELDDVRIDSRMVTEKFYWAIGKNLLTQYTLNFNRRKAGDVVTDERGGNALLTHHLGERLTTTFGVGVASVDFDGGGEDRYRSDLGFDYRQPLPIGSIDLSASYHYDRTNRDASGKEISTQSRVVLTTGDEAVLGAENIDPDSIVVTDVGGGVVFTEGVDYQVFEAGSEVRISRSLLGAIPDGEEVLVHYNYRVDSAYEDSRFGQDYRFDLSLWSFMSLTGIHRRLDQRILSGEPPSGRMDGTENSLYLRFDVGWSETRFEYAIRDRKSGDATTVKSVRELINVAAFRRLFLNLSGLYGERDFTDIHASETFYTYGADIRWQLAWWCQAGLIGRRNHISGDLQRMDYSEFSPKIQLTYGLWKASLVYRLTDQQDLGIDNRLWRQRFYFTLDRALW